MPKTATDKAKSANEEPANTIAPAVVSERKTTLLVVEDDDKISEMISEHFSRAGFSVKTAEDGLAGVQAALNDHPDAVVLDLMLPKMDGLAVCREIREKAPYIPILMLTAKDDVVDKVLGLEMGAGTITSRSLSLCANSKRASNPFYDVHVTLRAPIARAMTRRLCAGVCALIRQSAKLRLANGKSN